MILSRENIKQVVQEYFKDKPVNKVYLFGSYARGDADERSDVDLLVELDYSKKISWGYYLWQNEISDIIKWPVHLASQEELHDFINSFVSKEKELLYEK
ncbi:MAG: nucleotidyltransferase domain-containing protein [Bacteroidota bacterium]|nr:nucleotidyltransferase domain-containing protein [Bacteroidota bacterium]